MTDVVRRRVLVRGIVQGVGFRPAVHRHAAALGLVGVVGNDGRGVFIEVEGPALDVDRFVSGIRDVAPPLATVDSVDVEQLPIVGDEDEFRIVESDPSGGPSTMLPPDLAPCPDCRRELLDPTDRRHRYPFLNCTRCGPRYSIVRSLPYDRSTTTMAGFSMCRPCRAEFEDPTDRRFHAQPTCCPACGPTLRFRDRAGRHVPVDDVLGTVVDRLRHGEIVAVKGVGGFHLVVDATDEEAVARLRRRKHREDKPFAVLVADVRSARRLARLSPVERDLLEDPARPIVLLDRRVDVVAPSVAPGTRSLGLFLPPSPLHLLLAQDVGRPLVATSGNRSDEPIVVDGDDAVERLAGIADAYCDHDRPIHIRVDDSVTRVVADRQIVIRRARGLAPRPIRVPAGFPRAVLACGAHLKSTVCLARDDVAVVSPHLGDLEHLATYDAFVSTVDHLGRLFGVRPELVAHDLHPDMRSTAYAHSLPDVETVAVQHHHAHVASCLADNEHDGTVIGMAFDGLGLGVDGSVWGGEVLLADRREFERVGHLRPVPMPGGDAAVRAPWRMALTHLVDTLGVDGAAALEVARRQAERWAAVESMAAAGINSPVTSSMGRFFDAVASVIGLHDDVTYEGQAAVALEQAADPAITDAYPSEVADGRPFVLDTRPIIRAVAADLDAGVPRSAIAARFHNGIVDLIDRAAALVRERTGVSVVALSGGVFQNALLVTRSVERLTRTGFTVLTHRRVPPNDGGISLGQAVVAGARDRAGLHGSAAYDACMDLAGTPGTDRS